MAAMDQIHCKEPLLRLLDTAVTLSTTIEDIKKLLPEPPKSDLTHSLRIESLELEDDISIKNLNLKSGVVFIAVQPMAGPALDQGK